MSNPWFRLYSEFSTDPKVQSMPEEMQRRLVMAFCLRCSNDHVTLQDCDVAFHWRISNDQLKTTKALFIEKGVINDAWDVLNWNKRQFISDSSAERVRRHRAKNKKACNVTVTAPDTDTDTETTPKRVDDKFESFWKTYPRKQGKGAAEKAWKKAHVNGEFDSLLAALERQKCSDQWRKDGGQFVPNPATWINQRRWEDELSGSQASASDPFRGAI
jgi:hypothetical protein